MDVRERPATARSVTAAAAAPVTVAVVSYNTRALLLRCLEALAAEAAGGRAEVWVIDNGSTDGSVAAARAAAPWARVEPAPANLGFGAAVNAIARRTTGAWLLVLNADAAPEPGALDALLATGADPRTGAVAPRLVLPDATTQHSVHPFPTVALALAFNLGVHRLWPALGRRWCLPGGWDDSRARPIAWALGACLLVRRDAFAQAGGFDERQWMYAEDIDLCWRLADRGWTVRYAPEARVRHADGAATAPAFGDGRRTRHLAATYRLLDRRRGRTRMLVTAVLNLAGATGRLTWMAPAAILSSRWRPAAAENRAWLVAHAAAVARALRAEDR